MQGQVLKSIFTKLNDAMTIPNLVIFKGLIDGVACRWGGTPLQDAVNASNVQIISMLHSKGGSMPQSLSATQVHVLQDVGYPF